MKTILITCANCQKQVSKRKALIEHKIKHGTRKHLFCSILCSDTYRSKVQLVICKHCSIEFSKSFSEIKSTSNNFCSRSCAAKFNNKCRKGTRRSKCEILLCELLHEQFPNLPVLPNDKTMLDGFEVDIAIPSLNLAIEWNGIVHYKPIYGQEKLQIIQSMDQKKVDRAAKKNVSLVIVEDLVSTTDFVHTTFSQIAKTIDSLLLLRRIDSNDD